MELFNTNLNGTRLGTILQTLLYISGVPLFHDNTTIITSNGIVTRSTTSVFRNLEVEGPHPDDPQNTRCYGALGCITVKYPQIRGFHLFPDPLQDIKPSICLYNHYAPDTCQEVEPDTIDRLKLDVNNTHSEAQETYWITHGYVENANRPWLPQMKDELLGKPSDNDVNIFIIDWSKGAEPPYTQAVANLELVAAYTAHVMLLLQETHGLRIGHTHFIGHSLGAHFAGFIGSWLQRHAGQHLARISGLDPAQPYFQNLPPDARLDPTDALFVDVIHTDAKPLLSAGLGTQQPSGHVDFYPNSGRDQPGCKDGVYNSILQEEGSLISGLRRFIVCDHIRSYEYYTESIRSPCSFTSFACPSWASFISSNCTSGSSPYRNEMGFHAKIPISYHRNMTQMWTDGVNENKEVLDDSILYYSLTGSKFPFCQRHYEISINVSGFSAVKTVPDLQLLIYSPTRRASTNRVFTIGKKDLEEQSRFIMSGPALNFPVTRVLLKHTSHRSIWWLVKHRTRTSDITIESVTVADLETGVSVRLCPEGRAFLAFNEQDPQIILTRDACVP